MTYKLLKFLFFFLLLLPIVVIGFCFFVRLWKNKVDIIKADKKRIEDLKTAEMEAELENKRKQNFFDDYDKSKGYR